MRLSPAFIFVTYLRLEQTYLSFYPSNKTHPLVSASPANVTEIKKELKKAQDTAFQ